MLLERFSLDYRKTKTKVKYTSQPKGVVKPKPIPFDSQVKTALTTIFFLLKQYYSLHEGWSIMTCFPSNIS